VTASLPHHDAVIVGGGHNGLVAACYLARAGLSVLLLERLDHVGGASVSERLFAGVDARLSRYSYLVSLLPDQIVEELGLRFSVRRRRFASYTPLPGTDAGILIDEADEARTRESLRRATGDARTLDAWSRFYGMTGRFAEAIAPTLLEPLRSREQLRALVEPEAWETMVERPLGESLERTFADDVVRGIVLTDALIGTFAHAADPSLVQNRCLLYHVTGNGTGAWNVPVGGMGALVAELQRVARAAGATIVTGAEALAIESDGEEAEVRFEAADGEQRVPCSHVLAGCAPRELDRLLGRPERERPEGSQVKLNMLLSRLPRLRDPAVTPHEAFSGTLHVNESLSQLDAAYADAAADRLPDPLPCEIYCHTLTDPSILAPELAAAGVHTLTLFGLQVPARLFVRDREDRSREALRLTLESLDSVLAEPIAGCLLTDADGRPCLELKTPLDLEDELRLPGGNIFHRALAWPFAEHEDEIGRWGTETDLANVHVCGAGARRGGAVSGIPGRNAALAVCAGERRTTGVA
jgi:phytoene dehydrogenase-like protein